MRSRRPANERSRKESAGRDVVDGARTGSSLSLSLINLAAASSTSSWPERSGIAGDFVQAIGISHGSSLASPEAHQSTHNLSPALGEAKGTSTTSYPVTFCTCVVRAYASPVSGKAIIVLASKVSKELTPQAPGSLSSSATQRGVDLDSIRASRLSLSLSDVRAGHMFPCCWPSSRALHPSPPIAGSTQYEWRSWAEYDMTMPL